MPGKQLDIGAVEDSNAVSQQNDTQASSDAWTKGLHESVASTSGAVEPGSTVKPGSGGGLTINIAYDSSITALKSTNATLYDEYTAAITTAVQYYESLIKTPVTVTINFGYGEVNGQTLAPSAVAESSTDYQGFYTYTQVYNAIKSTYSSSSAVQAAALASLSAADPTGGGSFALSDAEATALGLYSGTSTAWVGISTLSGTGNSWNWTQSGFTSTQFDVIGALEHEISEDLGRVDFGGRNAFGAGGADYSLLDLFRYDVAGDIDGAAPGTAVGPRDLSATTSNYTYFSYNGKTVTLEYDEPTYVAQGADIADWGATVSGDSYGFANPGIPGLISPTDLAELSVLGYALAGPQIAGTVAGQVIADQQTIQPFSKATVTETDGSTPTLTLTVTLSSAANGALSNLGGGSYNATTGVYTVSGSASAVTTALDGLVFTPTANQVLPGQAVTTTFTIAANDGIAAPATDSTTTVIAREPQASDFIGTGTSDVLWFNSASGGVLYWAITDGAVAASDPIAGFSPGSGWSVLGTADFTGGLASDVLLEYSSGGEDSFGYWALQKGAYSAYDPLAGFAANSGWAVLGTGDFTGNGTDDVLLGYTSGGETHLYDWQVANGAVAATNNLNMGFSTSAGWEVLGTGDFYGEGVSDVLFEDTLTGAVADWRVQNDTASTFTIIAGVAPGGGWVYDGVGDFNGDGTSDILWQNGATLAIWEIQNGALLKSVTVSTAAPTGYTFEGVGDYFDSGTSDILWQNQTNGQTLIWEMQNAQVVATTTPGAADPSSWHIVK